MIRTIWRVSFVSFQFDFLSILAEAIQNTGMTVLILRSTATQMH